MEVLILQYSARNVKRTNVVNMLRLIDRLRVDFQTNDMLILSTRNIYIVNINNIERKPFVKYLGVYTDEFLNWEL